MSKEEEQYHALFMLWQDKVQDFWRDPKVINAMLGGYIDAQEAINAFYGGSGYGNWPKEESKDTPRAGNHNQEPVAAGEPKSTDEHKGGDVLASLRNAVAELSTRLRELEQEVAALRDKSSSPEQHKADAA